MYRRFLIGSLMVMACALFTAGRANADAIDNFTFTGGSNTYTWSLPSSPVVAADNFADGIGFVMGDVAYALNGVAQAPGEFDFYSILDFGGFDTILADESMPLNEFGLQIYRVGAPTFLPGTYHFLGSDAPSGTLTIASVSAPEPGSLALTGLGVLVLFGLAARRKRTVMPTQLRAAC
jgi:hypothetical protein